MNVLSLCIMLLFGITCYFSGYVVGVNALLHKFMEIVEKGKQRNSEVKP